MNIITIKIRYEQDTVLARQRARRIAELLGFDNREQTAIATSVSEIVRNAYNYAKESTIEFSIDEQAIPQVMYITVRDEGPGIANLDKILNGSYSSTTGLGVGIKGSRKLMDFFQVDTIPGKGTTVIMGKKLPIERKRINLRDISTLTGELAKEKARTPFEEITEQNQELLATLEEVRKKQEELIRLNKELEETNRGVVALYAELDERAEHLKRMNDVKARFFSNMSHEFKTPLNSIAALSRLLLDRTDGPLTEEQTKQIKYIQKSTSELYEIVNDLLDIAKIESGKIQVKAEYFSINDMLASLRGIMRPLLTNPAVNLIFEEPKDLPEMYSDETKVAQILRNFISNALKFTEKGEVRIKALTRGNSHIIFEVADTGIGIAESDLEYIFEEFSQIDNGIQKHVRGTGLGLPLTKKLAETLGGEIRVESKPGRGSVFSAVLPVHYTSQPVEKQPAVVSDKIPGKTQFEEHLRVHPVSSIDAAGTQAEKVIIEVMLPAHDTWIYLDELRSREQSRNVPVIILAVSQDKKRSIAEKYSDIASMINKIRSKKDDSKKIKILIIDDEEIPRYVLSEMLPSEYFNILEADNGHDGLKQAIELQPDIIFLDIMMPDQSGFEVIKELNKNQITRNIPVIVNSSRVMSSQDREKLAGTASVLFKKENVSQEELLEKIKEALIQIIQQGIRVKDEL